MNRARPVQIDWKPDKSGAEPVYRQIVAFVLDKVSSGEWPVGTRLPPQRQLAEQFGVNRSTVTTAIEELTSYGMLAGGHGAGTQVISNTWSLLLPPAPDWDRYVSSGFFRANSETIQTINRLEFEPGILRLGTGELDPRLFPREIWADVLGRLSSAVTSLGYLEPLGLPQLREAIAARMAALGIRTTPSCILITSGSLQALHLISACLLQSGSTVFVEAPSYLKSLQIFQSAGMRLSGVPMGPEGMCFEEIGAHASLKKQRIPSIVYTIPTNHNPTGITMTGSRRRALMEFCEVNRLPIIEDGAYQELCFQGPGWEPLKALDRNGMVLYLGSVSKSFAPGLRIGWVVAPEPIVQRLGDVKMQMDYGGSSVSQWILTELFTSGMYDEYLDTLRPELLRRRDHALAVLDRHYWDIATWNVPQGGFYIWLTLREDVRVDRVFQEAIRAKILLNPGDIYDFQGNHALRLSYSYTTCEEFETAAVELAGMIRRLSGRGKN